MRTPSTSETARKNLVVATAALLAGTALGGGLVYGAAFGLSGSHSLAAIFAGFGLAFFLPITILFVAANHRANSCCLNGSPPSEPSPNDLVLAVAYALCTVPAWFAGISLLNGHLVWGVILATIWVATAYAPLRAAYRVRLWATYSELSQALDS